VHHPEQLRAVNALCRFVELAGPSFAPSSGSSRNVASVEEAVT